MLGADRCHSANAAATPARSRRQRRELVEQLEVRRGIEEHLMLVLAVKINEAAARIAKRGRRRERAVDERAAARPAKRLRA